VSSAKNSRNADQLIFFFMKLTL